eukprot:6174253-Pleurochrysis_carterae.AAC.1
MTQSALDGCLRVSAAPVARFERGGLDPASPPPGRGVSPKPRLGLLVRPRPAPARSRLHRGSYSPTSASLP